MTNARPHQGKRFVLNVDIEDFFPSITFPRVRGLFIKRFQMDARAATVLARLCCNTDDEPDHLPQGAPTSPIISNMICHSMDHALVRLADSHGLFYTRYADDLTFSTNRRLFPEAVAVEREGRLLRVGVALARVIDESGFSLNRNKSRLFGRSGRQEATGLTVNRRVNVQRRRIRELRGILHAWRKHGYDLAQDEYRRRHGGGHSLLRVVQGKLAFIKQVRGRDDRIFRRLYGWARGLGPDYFARTAAALAGALTGGCGGRVPLDFRRRLPRGPAGIPVENVRLGRGYALDRRSASQDRPAPHPRTLNHGQQCRGDPHALA